MQSRYNILAVPIASQMMDNIKVMELRDHVKELLINSNKDTNIVFTDEVMNERNWEDLTLEINRILDKFDGFIIIHLTGGTSRIVLEFLTDLNNIKPFALLALSRYNSLPSALNTRERIIQFLSKEVHIPIIYEKYDLEKLFHYFNVVDKALQRYDVLFLAPAIGVKVQPNFRLIRPARFSRFVKELSDKELNELLGKLRSTLKINYKGTKEERIAISLYKNLKIALENLSVKYGYSEIKGLACLDCYYIMRRRQVAPCLAVSLLLNDGFLVACQRDLLSLFAMLLLRLLTGQSSWIADVAKINRKENSLVLSHSCFNLSMATSAEVIPHPITHLPYSVRATVNAGTNVTLFTIDPATERFDALVGEIIDLRSYEPSFESTQRGRYRWSL